MWLAGYSPAATKSLFGCPEGRDQTRLPHRERLFVRVNHDRLGVVIGKRVIEAGLDDPFGNLGRRPCRRDTDALRPEAEVAQDALDHVALVDEAHDTHLFLALRAEERIGFPYLLNEFAPLCRRDAPRLVFGNVNHRHGLTGGLDRSGGLFAPLAAHLVGIPAIIPDKLEALVRYVLGDGGDEVARGEDVEIALDLGVQPGMVDDGTVGIGAVGLRDLHLLHGEGVANDVLGQALQVLALVRLHPPAAVDVEPGMHPAA